MAEQRYGPRPGGGGGSAKAGEDMAGEDMTKLVSMMDAPIYRLTIYTKLGRELSTYGPKAQLYPMLKHWISKEWIDSTILEVNGHMDTCDRAEHLAGVLMDEIEMMTMYLYT